MKYASEKLLFRRQYVIGAYPVTKLRGWKCIKLNNQLFITAHPDLETEQSTGDGIQLTLLGYMFDPDHPRHSNQEIIREMKKSVRSFEDVVMETDRMGGRYVLIYNDGDHVKMLHDPCGLRQIFFTTTEDSFWCGSQPAILQYVLGKELEIDPFAQRFANSAEYDKRERAWPGDGTIYKNVKHLLPNRYLDVNTRSIVRYWPNEKLERIELAQAVRVASRTLIDVIKAASYRYSLMLPVSAGWDSRMLLAASKEIRHQIFYYICRNSKMTAESMDIKVPQKLLERLGLDFHVIESVEDMEEEFAQIYEKNVTMARYLPKTLSIYQHFKLSQGKLNVCGNGSEIARKSTYTHYHRKNVTPEFLAKIYHYKGDPYVIDQVSKWLDEAYAVAMKCDLDIYDLYYWEQRMGNWGAMLPAEQDIAIEEFWPFNNRRLLRTLLSVEKEYRKPPNYLVFKALTKEMWEETLHEPINPMNLQEVIKKKLFYVYQSYLP